MLSYGQNSFDRQNNTTFYHSALILNIAFIFVLSSRIYNKRCVHSHFNFIICSSIIHPILLISLVYSFKTVAFFLSLPVYPCKRLNRSAWPSLHISQNNPRYPTYPAKPTHTCLKACCDCTNANACKWWVELWGYGWRLQARRWQGRGGTGWTKCHKAAVQAALCLLWLIYCRNV